MSRYIDADALLKELHKAKEENEKARMVLIDYDFETLIKDAPTVYIEPVRQGNNMSEYPSIFKCSECGCSDNDTYTCDTKEYNYCPNCGAKMDKE